jgi:hypothetical protein
MRCCFFIPLVLASCQDGPALNPERPDLRNVRAVTIIYSTTQLYDHDVKITDSKDLKALTDAFRIKEVRRMWTKLAALAAVEFHLADGSSEKFWYQAPEMLQWQGDHGRVDLQGRAFYDLVNKLLSKKEGRPIDVLKNNDPEKGPPKA